MAIQSGFWLRCLGRLLKLLPQFLQGAANISSLLVLAGLDAIGTGFDVLLIVEQFLICLCFGTPLQAPVLCLGAPAGGWDTDAVTPLAVLEDFLATPLLPVDIPSL